MAVIPDRADSATRSMTTEVSKADATELSTRRARIRSVHHQEAGS